ncbi:Protein of unknown function [Gryllus bimaculatus]|nr:Protein of unknown function [Gryllus bimaculatus]
MAFARIESFRDVAGAANIPSGCGRRALRSRPGTTVTATPVAWRDGVVIRIDFAAKGALALGALAALAPLRLMCGGRGGGRGVLHAALLLLTLLTREAGRLTAGFRVESVTSMHERLEVARQILAEVPLIDGRWMTKMKISMKVDGDDYDDGLRKVERGRREDENEMGWRGVVGWGWHPWECDQSS